VAGRVIVRTPDGIETKLVNIDRDLLIIPNLAIHMNRQVNDGYKFNAQADMLPLFCEKGEESDSFLKLIASEAGVSAQDILDTDLFLYNRMPAISLGLNKEFIASGRLDDLQCAFASLKGFLQASPGNSVAVHCVFDNEEVGSATKQGAAGTFLRDTLRRINRAMGRTEDDYLMSIASSFLVSADNAHAVHPNHTDKTDPTNRTYLNKGIIIKYSANQKYTTDAVSGAVMRAICRQADVPFQTFSNRSDMLGGSTLGNISQSQVALNTVDIGLPQLAMHSPYETAGAKDTAYLIEAAKVLFSSSIEGKGDGSYKLVF
jgi:aspartyl aminopeptidase